MMKSLFRKILPCICAAVLAFSFAACDATFIPPGADDGSGTVTRPGGNQGSNGSSQEKPSDGSQEGQEQTYTVKLQLADQTPFSSEVYNDVVRLSAIWTNIDNSKNAVSARFNSDGEATAELDGDYRIKLSSLPAGYTYDCNSYIARSDSKTVAITMIPILTTSGERTTSSTLEGGAPYRSWATLRTVREGELAAYRVTVNSGEEAFFSISLSRTANYSVTTLCDVYANKIKPTLIQYNANSVSKAFFGRVKEERMEVVEPTASYTKNLKFYIQNIIEEKDQVNEYFFSVGGESKDGGEVTVDFIFKREENSANIAPPKVESKWDFDSDEHAFTIPAGKTGKLFGDVVSKDLHADYAIKGELLKEILTGKETEKESERKVNRQAIIAKYSLNLSDSEDLNSKIKDDFYYLRETGDMLYVPLGVAMPFILDQNSGVPLSYRQAYNTYINGFNYENFVATYSSHLESGCYPLNDELKHYLTEFARHSGSPFFADNTGKALLEHVFLPCFYCRRTLGFYDFIDYYNGTLGQNLTEEEIIGKMNTATHCFHCGERVTYTSDKDSMWLLSCYIFV